MIRYANTAAGLRAPQLAGFFEGWSDPPSPETHLRILQGSARVIVAIDTTDDGDENVVGFINAVSDGVLAAYVPLLEVLPSHRGRGIGSELVRRMVDALGDLYMVDVVCDSDVQPFYEKLGFAALVGMARRNHASQAGAPAR